MYCNNTIDIRNKILFLLLLSCDDFLLCILFIYLFIFEYELKFE
jgi:hypothetical protein